MRALARNPPTDALTRPRALEQETIAAKATSDALRSALAEEARVIEAAKLAIAEADDVVEAAELAKPQRDAAGAEVKKAKEADAAAQKALDYKKASLPIEWVSFETATPPEPPKDAKGWICAQRRYDVAFDPVARVASVTLYERSADGVFQSGVETRKRLVAFAVTRVNGFVSPMAVKNYFAGRPAQLEATAAAAPAAVVKSDFDNIVIDTVLQ